MSKHSLRVAVVAGTTALLVGGGGAIAWADTFTPAIEEPTYFLGILGNTPLTGGAPGGNNYADSRDGRTYNASSDDGGGAGSSDSDYGSTEDNGYWRTSEDR